MGRGVWSCGRGRGWHTCRVEFGCEWIQRCLLFVQNGWLRVCQVVELSQLEAWVVGPVWMGVKMGVQSPAVWVLAV